jgi:hypothetical protein
MSKISTYANATPVTLSDKFIGTEVAGTPVNVTKNFLISDLLTLFQSNVTLQNVLDAGNTATQSIILTGAITQTGDFGITGNITQTGNIGLTGDINHAGAYLYSGGQFTMAATGTMVLGGALSCSSSVSLLGSVKDYNNTLGTDGKILISDASGQVTWQDSIPTTVRSSALTTTNIILADKNGVVITNTSTSTDVRIPTNAGAAFAIGTKITIIQEGSGTVTVVGTAGVTLQSSQGHDRLSHQYSVATVVKTAIDTWYLYGDIKA